MDIFIPREIMGNEPRVAASPESVKKIKALGARVMVEAGAGASSFFSDGDYAAAGADIISVATQGYASADIILKLRAPSLDELAHIKKDAVLMGLLEPYDNDALIEALAKAQVTAFAVELLPRISRAQSMDVLSSQANLAGYRAVIAGAEAFGRALPMMMTAAGTVPAAKIFIMGVGVAGLQAIATARRLGAVVTATDVRPATKEQVASLGAKFIAVEDEEFKAAETAGGYAKQMSPAYQEKQAALIAGHIAKQDIVITTALIPGRLAPVLVSEDMVKSMRPGSIIIDLAAERGGNCALTKPGQTTNAHGVTILGATNLAGHLPATASALYARNLYAFLETLIDKKTGSLALNFEDELQSATCLTHGGKILQDKFAPAAPLASNGAILATAAEAGAAMQDPSISPDPLEDAGSSGADPQLSAPEPDADGERDEAKALAKKSVAKKAPGKKASAQPTDGHSQDPAAPPIQP